MVKLAINVRKEVTLKDGKKIKVMQREIEVLRKAGKLKEEKSSGQTKEDKTPAETKEEKSEGEAKANISTKNIKGSRPKKV